MLHHRACCCDEEDPPHACCSSPCENEGCFWDIGDSGTVSTEMDIVVVFDLSYDVESLPRPLPTIFTLHAPYTNTYGVSAGEFCNRNSSNAQTGQTWQIIDGSPTNYNNGRADVGFRGVSCSPTTPRFFANGYTWHHSATPISRTYGIEGSTPNRAFHSISGVSWACNAGWDATVGNFALFGASINYGVGFENGSPGASTGPIHIAIDMVSDLSVSHVCSTNSFELISVGDTTYTGSFGGNDWRLELHREIYMTSTWTGLTACTEDAPV